jgi:hypothetical protein
MQKVGICKEILLALLRPGIATCPTTENTCLQCLQTPALLPRHSISISDISFAASHSTHGGSTIPPWCRYRVGTVQSFLNIDICICLDAKTPCKINEVCYSLTNNCYRRHNNSTKLVRAAEHLEHSRQCCLKRGHTLRIVGYRPSHPVEMPQHTVPRRHRSAARALSAALLYSLDRDVLHPW